MPTSPKWPRASAVCAHVWPHVREGGTRVARRFRELLPEHLRVAFERALRALEAQHDAGELLCEAIVELLRDALSFAGGRLLLDRDGVGRPRELEQILRGGRREVRFRFGVRVRAPP